MTGTPHTSAEIERVRRLVLAGFSRAQVADRMGLSRNTIVGLANRYITKQERTAAARLKRTKPKAPAPVKRTRARRSRPTTLAMPAPPATMGIPFLDVGPMGCAWPVRRPWNALLWRRSVGLGT